MKIGITRSDTNFPKYIEWLEYFNVDFEILDYLHPKDAFAKFENCSGLILSGGVDIYPELYCDWDTKETKGTYCPERDGLELRLMEFATGSNKPILGICRGLQLINVFFRGSLIFDILEIRNVNHKGISGIEPKFHDVNIFKDTLLYNIANIEQGNINTYHHQAVDRLGEGLMINAKSDDGIIEGIEYNDKFNKPFLLGVQWHPERIEDLNSPFSKNILDKFLSECKLINV